MEHSAPFLLPVEPDDTLEGLRERLRAKLGVPAEDFEHWELSVAKPQSAKFVPLGANECSHLYGHAEVRQLIVKL